MAAAIATLVLALLSLSGPSHYVRRQPVEPSPPPQVPSLPADAAWDYQIGGDYPLPGGVTVVSRDWFEGEPAGDYAVCYVNAFQTEADDDDVDRPD